MEMMTEIDWSECPIVQRNPKKLGGVPTVRAWRISADSIVENSDYGMTAAEIAETYNLPVDDVRTILAYALKAREIAHSVR